MKIKINSLRISVILLILSIICLIILSYPNIKEILYNPKPPREVIFNTEKFYNQNGDFILTFSLINPDTKRRKIISDIKFITLASRIQEFLPGATQPVTLDIKLKNIKRRIKINNTDDKNSTSLIEGEKVYYIEPKERFPLLARFKINMKPSYSLYDPLYNEAIILFKLDVIYQDPPFDQKIKKTISSDKIYFIDCIEGRYFRLNEWSIEKFIEDNLDILRNGINEYSYDHYMEIKLKIKALGKLNDKRIEPVLINSLQKYKDDFTLFSPITEALGNIKDKKAIKALVTIIEEDEKMELDYNKLDAIKALANIGDKSVVPIIRKYFDKQDSLKTKIEIAQALNKLGENYDLTDIIVDSLNSEEISNREDALFFIYLKWLRFNEYLNERIVNTVIRRFKIEEDDNLRDLCQSMLESLLSREIIDDFLKDSIRKSINNHKRRSIEIEKK